jgi:hypothetical protein
LFPLIEDTMGVQSLPSIWARPDPLDLTAIPFHLLDTTHVHSTDMMHTGMALTMLNGSGRKEDEEDTESRE